MNPGDVAIYIGPDDELRDAKMVIVKTENLTEYLKNREIFVRAIPIGNIYGGNAEHIKKEYLQIIGNISEIKSEAFKILSGDW